MSALLFALLCAADPSASASVHAESRTFVMVAGRPYYSVDDGRVVERRVAPVLQEIFLDADPAVEGFSIVLDAWLTLDAAERVLSSPAIADVDQGWVRWRGRGFTVTAGRFFNPTITGRGLRVDGGRVTYQTAEWIEDFDLSLDVWGGAPVSPAFGAEPLERATPVFTNDPLEVAPEGADWRRPGDVAGGGTLRVGYGGLVELAVGYDRVQDLAEVAHEAVSASVVAAPLSWLGASAYGAYSLYAGAPEAAELSLYARPIRPLQVRLIGGYSNPSMLLPATSILSVFGGAEHGELALEADWYFSRALRVGATAELRTSALGEEDDETDTALGYRLAASARGRFAALYGVTASAGWEVLQDGWYGRYHLLRAGAELPLGAFGVSADTGLFVVQSRPVADANIDEQQVALRGGLSGWWHRGSLRAVLALRGTTLDEASREVAIIGRLEWAGDLYF